MLRRTKSSLAERDVKRSLRLFPKRLKKRKKLDSLSKITSTRKPLKALLLKQMQESTRS